MPTKEEKKLKVDASFTATCELLDALKLVSRSGTLLGWVGPMDGENPEGYYWPNGDAMTKKEQAEILRVVHHGTGGKETPSEAPKTAGALLVTDSQGRQGCGHRKEIRVPDGSGGMLSLYKACGQRARCKADMALQKGTQAVFTFGSGAAQEIVPRVATNVVESAFIMAGAGKGSADVQAFLARLQDTACGVSQEARIALGIVTHLDAFKVSEYKPNTGTTTSTTGPREITLG